MMRTRLAIAALLAAFLIAEAGASSTYYAPAVDNGGYVLCNSVFNQISANTLFNSVASGSYITAPEISVLKISLLITMAVLSLLAIAYAVGEAFNISSLKEFVRKEYIESFFNIILIMVVAGGLSFAGAAMGFFTNIESLSLTSPGSMTSGSFVATSAFSTTSYGNMNTAGSLYLSLCSDYLNSGIYSGIFNIVYMIPTLYFASYLQGVSFTLAPLGIGLSVTPFAGLYSYTQVQNVEMDLYVAVMGLEISVAMMLVLIYFIFPVFLYVGILLRSFPWTRAAGGAMVALFIAFYIVFPALLYPFLQYQSSIDMSCTNIVTSNTASSCVPSTNYFSAAASDFFSIFPVISNTPINTQMRTFSMIFSQFGLHVVGLIISFIISFDLLEGLGDLLGAPSLQSGRLMGRMI